MVVDSGQTRFKIVAILSKSSKKYKFISSDGTAGPYF